MRNPVCLWGCVGLVWSPAVVGCEWIGCGWSCCACVGGDGGGLLRVEVCGMLSIAVFGVLRAAFDVKLSVVGQIWCGGAVFYVILICGLGGVGRAGYGADECAKVDSVVHLYCGWAAVEGWLWQ